MSTFRSCDYLFLHRFSLEKEPEPGFLPCLYYTLRSMKLALVDFHMDDSHLFILSFEPIVPHEREELESKFPFLRAVKQELFSATQCSFLMEPDCYHNKNAYLIELPLVGFYKGEWLNAEEMDMTSWTNGKSKAFRECIEKQTGQDIAAAKLYAKEDLIWNVKRVQKWVYV